MTLPWPSGFGQNQKDPQEGCNFVFDELGGRFGYFLFFLLGEGEWGVRGSGGWGGGSDF